MKRTIYYIFLLLLPFSAFAQNDWPGYTDPQNMEVVMDREAFFPKSQEYLYDYFFYHIRYGEEAIQNEVTGEVLLSFIVNMDSTISEIMVVKGVGYGIDEKVIEAIKPLKFAPATLNGIFVNSSMMMAIPVRAIAWDPNWENEFNFDD